MMQVAALKGGMAEAERLMEHAKQAVRWVHREIGVLESKNAQLKGAVQGKEEEMHACKVALLQSLSSGC